VLTRPCCPWCVTQSRVAPRLCAHTSVLPLVCHSVTCSTTAVRSHVRAAPGVSLSHVKHHDCALTRPCCPWCVTQSRVAPRLCAHTSVLPLVCHSVTCSTTAVCSHVRAAPGVSLSHVQHHGCALTRPCCPWCVTQSRVAPRLHAHTSVLPLVCHSVTFSTPALRSHVRAAPGVSLSHV